MGSWKRTVVIAAGFGAGFATAAMLIVGVWTWYASQPKKPTPWDQQAITATFDYPDITVGTEPEKTGRLADLGFVPDIFVLYYTLENHTDFDYELPSPHQLEITARLKRQNSLSGSDSLIRPDSERIFIPAKQRRRLGIQVSYPVTLSPGADPKTPEERQKRSRLIAEHLTGQFTNLDGFVMFDKVARYQINLLNGWEHFKSE